MQYRVKLQLPDPICDLEVIQELPGRGYSKVYQVRTTEGFAILKLSSNPRERNFYEHLAEIVQQQGVLVPKLYWSGLVSGQHAILIEYLPELLPKSRWRMDDEAFEKLAFLHRIQAFRVPFEIENHFWPKELVASALIYFEPELKNRMSKLLFEMRTKYQHTFFNQCVYCRVTQVQ